MRVTDVIPPVERGNVARAGLAKAGQPKPCLPPLLRSASILVPMLLILVLACGTNDEAAESKDDIGLVWEAWQIIDESYSNRQALDIETVVGSSLQAMLNLADGSCLSLFHRGGPC